jgi:DNA-binding NtrC family response regulator
MSSSFSDDPPGTTERTVVRRSHRLKRVVVLEGPDQGRVVEIDQESPSRLLIGTSPSCEIRLTDPSVSRRHAALEPSDDRFRVTDLSSTNGTFLDRIAVLSAYVRGGETLRVGRTVLSLEAEIVAEPECEPEVAAFGPLIGGSEAMRRLYPRCRRLADAQVPVIIEGETGTGKEQLAEALHQEGPRRDGPFVVFDCTAVSPQLIEAELFGHERGAFTGAITMRPGFFEQANEGTLLIDEIGDLDLALQAKLLRVIDRGEVRRVGSTKPTRIDVRVLCATRRNLDKEVAEGRFRDDLYHRLAVARVELPPLRARVGDIRRLAEHFAGAMGASHVLTPATIAKFEGYDWPGNVRELRNAVAGLVALGEDVPPSERLRSRSAADPLTELCKSDVPFPIARRRVLEEFERRYVQNVLAAHNGNVVAAARASGIALRYFQLVRARYGRQS